MATRKDKDFIIPETRLLCKAENFKYYVRLILGKNEDGTIDERWVTEVSYSPKTFRYDFGKKAREFSLAEALDFTFAAGINGFCAKVEIIPTWTGNLEMYLTNPEKEAK